MDVHATSAAAKPIPASPNGGMQRILKFSLALTLLYILATLYFGLRAGFG